MAELNIISGGRSLSITDLDKIFEVAKVKVQDRLFYINHDHASQIITHLSEQFPGSNQEAEKLKEELFNLKAKMEKQNKLI